MDQLAEATREQARTADGRNLGEILVKKGFITPSELQHVVQVQKTMLSRGKQGQARQAPAPRQAARESKADPNAQRSLYAVLRQAVETGASDVHIHSGAPLALRVRGELVEQGDGPIDRKRGEATVLAAMTDEEREIFANAGEVDFCCTVPQVGRFRSNAYRQLHGVDGVFRYIPARIPSLEDLNLPSSLARFTNFHQGMVLITGPARCGKSTTMASLVSLVNEERREHVLTVEDPIEFIHESKRCLVNQRQARRHTESFARALRAALREDPDVIVIGELRDPETVSLALTAAETGHFVLATLHTDNSIRTVDRLVGSFPPSQQDQVRTMLSESLRAVISQRLVRTVDGSRQVPALEILVITRAVSKMIRDNKTFQLPSILQTGAAQGMRLLDDSLAELVSAGVIDKEEALQSCDDPKRFGGQG